MSAPTPRVAVIGLGAFGVAAVKNFLEVGLNVVGLERNEYIGGMWRWSPDPSHTTVLKSTQANISKQSSCYTDFPFPDRIIDYPHAEDIAKYIDSYADHFSLKSHCRFGVTVENIERSSDRQKWSIRTRTRDSESKEELFDKVIIANGAYNRTMGPKYEGADQFRGRILHSRAFKTAHDFAKQRVVVVGLSNTAGDTTVELSGVAEKVFVSHRSGNRIFGRPENGPPVDHQFTRRKSALGYYFSTWFPNLANAAVAFMLERHMKKTYPYMQKSWKLLPGRPISNAPPMFNDHIMELFRDGSAESVTGIRRFLDDGTSIELTDGTILESIDAVILCTGYAFDYSVLAPEVRPTRFPTPEWDALQTTDGMKFARLYQGMLDSEYPDSLAFLGAYKGHSFAVFANADLMATALAQMWTGNTPLPTQEEITRWCQRNYQEQLRLWKRWRTFKLHLRPKELEDWLNVSAGNGLKENLGWGWQGWKFWWNEHELYRLIMDGINCPAVYRLFDGKRKKWDGAREEIYKVNGKTIKTRKEG